MRLVDVYFNLNKLVWSIRDRSSGRVTDYSRVVFFPNQVDFIVQPGGRARAVRERRRNVHAFVRGHDPMLYDDVINWKWFIENAFPGDKPTLISYNPFRTDYFYEVSTFNPVYSAHRLAMIAPEGEKPQVWSLPPIKSGFVPSLASND